MGTFLIGFVGLGLVLAADWIGHHFQNDETKPRLARVLLACGICLVLLSILLLLLLLYSA